MKCNKIVVIYHDIAIMSQVYIYFIRNNIQNDRTKCDRARYEF